MRMVVRLLLGFSLLVSFTTSAAAGLCLQMEHRDSVGMPAVMAPTDPLGQMANPDVVTHAPGIQESPSSQACCHQQVSTPQAVTATLRALPAEPTDVLLPAVAPIWADDGDLPPGLFDPALQKRDHLRPSLTVLSISRT